MERPAHREAVELTVEEYEAQLDSALVLQF